jgi:hypothetical protein
MGSMLASLGRDMAVDLGTANRRLRGYSVELAHTFPPFLAGMTRRLHSCLAAVSIRLRRGAQAGIHAVLYQDNSRAIRDIENLLAL